MLQEMLRARPDLRIFVLDAHNEYGRPFANEALILNPRNLKMPFWLFNFEEIIDVFFGARAGWKRRSTSSRRSFRWQRRATFKAACPWIARL